MCVCVCLCVCMCTVCVYVCVYTHTHAHMQPYIIHLIHEPHTPSNSSSSSLCCRLLRKQDTEKRARSSVDIMRWMFVCLCACVCVCVCVCRQPVAQARHRIGDTKHDVRSSTNFLVVCICLFMHVFVQAVAHELCVYWLVYVWDYCMCVSVRMFVRYSLLRKASYTYEKEHTHALRIQPQEQRRHVPAFTPRVTFVCKVVCVNTYVCVCLHSHVVLCTFVSTTFVCTVSKRYVCVLK
jgi:hypothetical protein